jgi:outer membrane protein assembly factor BamD (BamD/ComL family)
MNRISSSLTRTQQAIAIGLLLTCSACWAFGDNATGNMPKMVDPAQLSGVKAGEAARPAIGVPLIQAEGLIKDGHFAEAMLKVREAEKSTPDMTAYERYSINRTKAAAAMGMGQTGLALDATESAIATGHLGGEPQADLIASLVHAAYAAKDYARAVQWADRYAADGGTRADIAPLRMQALYLSGDYAGAAAALQSQIQADDAAGRVSSEREFQLLASAQRKIKDEAGVIRTVERLATRYPKPAYWADLLARVDRKTLSERLFLDLLRLGRATGNLVTADETLALAELAQSAGFAGETLAVLDEADANGLFKDAELTRRKALHEKARKMAAEDTAARKRDEAAARSAKDGNALGYLGQTVAAEGRLDAGIAMMEQGLAKGGVRRADELTLRLGEAQALAGRKQAAMQTLANIKGGEGMTELAHLWWLYAGITPAAPVVAAQAPAAPAASSPAR